jgi:hypothetical protein
MKKMFGSFAFTFALAATTVAHSSVAWHGQLQDMHFMKNGTVLVTSTGSRTTAPACAAVAGRFALDSSTEIGRTQLAGLIAAEAADRTVVIVGTGACDVYGDSETIEYFYIVG